MSPMNEKLIEFAIVEMKKKAVELGVFRGELKNYENVQLNTQISRILLDFLKFSETPYVLRHAPRFESGKEQRADVYAIWVRISETLPWIEIEGTFQTRAEARKATEVFLGNMLAKIVSLPLKGGIYDRDRLVKVVRARGEKKPNHNSEL